MRSYLLLLFLCVTFYSSETLNQPYTGWGRGFRRAICEWYMSHEPQALAREVTKHPGGNWTHKDILKLIHMKPKTPGKVFAADQHVQYNYSHLHD